MDRVAKLREFLQQSPDDCFLLHALALEYVKMGDDDTARTYFEQLLAGNPGYIGSYYHLGKLLERAGEKARSSEIYETGMKHARTAGDNHAYNELQAALEDLMDY